jgi:AAA lid domain
LEQRKDRAILAGAVTLALVIAGRGRVSVDELLTSRAWANLWCNLAHSHSKLHGAPQIVVRGTSLTRSSLKHGSCSRRIGLRGNNDRGRSDLGHDTHYAFKLARSVANVPNEYRKYIEKDAALERRFQTVKVEAPTLEEAVQILKGLRPNYETHHKAKLTDEALEAAVRLSDRYITGRFLPDKAIDVMDEAGARARINSMTRPPDVKEIKQTIETIRAEKEEAIIAQDYEKAGALRDSELHMSWTDGKRLAKPVHFSEHLTLAWHPQTIVRSKERPLHFLHRRRYWVPHPRPDRATC